MLIEANAKILYGKDRKDFLKNLFVERTIEHSNLVAAYGEIIGRHYSTHDYDKLVPLLESYCYYMIPAEHRTLAEEEMLNVATLKHITSNPHHPEFWTKTRMDGWKRDCTTPHGIIDATRMPNDCIAEMVCDWAATSDEKKGNLNDWINKVVPTRWKFTKDQMDYIRSIADKLETKYRGIKFNVGDLVTYNHKYGSIPLTVVARSINKSGVSPEYCLEGPDGSGLFLAPEHSLCLYKRNDINDIKLKGEK